MFPPPNYITVYVADETPLLVVLLDQLPVLSSLPESVNDDTGDDGLENLVYEQDPEEVPDHRLRVQRVRLLGRWLVEPLNVRPVEIPQGVSHELVAIELCHGDRLNVEPGHSETENQNYRQNDCRDHLVEVLSHRRNNLLRQVNLPQNQNKAVRKEQRVVGVPQYLENQNEHVHHDRPVGLEDRPEKLEEVEQRGRQVARLVLVLVARVSQSQSVQENVVVQEFDESHEAGKYYSNDSERPEIPLRLVIVPVQIVELVLRGRRVHEHHYILEDYDEDEQSSLVVKRVFESDEKLPGRSELPDEEVEQNVLVDDHLFQVDELLVHISDLVLRVLSADLV